MTPDGRSSGIVMIGRASTRFTGLAFLAALSACGAAPTAADYQASLRGVTAEALGLADASTITVKDEARVNAKWTWKAAVAGVNYACDADDAMRLPSCVQES
jgi:hypothetical protein